jgi:hypothetical protein
MRICTDASRLALTAGQTVTLRDAQGARIDCLSGSLWITEEGATRDVVLGPGEDARLERPGKTLVHAFKPSEALVFESRPAAPGTPLWKRLAYALMCHFMALGMRRSAWRRAYRI